MKSLLFAALARYQGGLARVSCPGPSSSSEQKVGLQPGRSSEDFPSLRAEVGHSFCALLPVVPKSF